MDSILVPIRRVRVRVRMRVRVSVTLPPVRLPVRMVPILQSESAFRVTIRVGVRTRVGLIPI